MRMVDLIHKKRQGGALSQLEINYIVSGYTQGEIPDYQMSAFLMAVFYQGMKEQEIADLTTAMVATGDIIDLSQINGIKVDKHSTGGVGDKISFIVAPLVAAVGVPVAKMSGRGLGHTGGTIDKLESIPGFQVELSNAQFIERVNAIKMAIVGQTGNLAPADKKIYALRDVTATVDSIPLIASSIMSKKIASGADCIVLDVKVGTGAFMKSLEEARALAQTMVQIGKRLNKRTVAVLTDMNQPLGHEIGNANEIKEAIDVLQGNGPDDIKLISLTIAAHMSVLGGIYPDFAIAYGELAKILGSGAAFETFKRFVAAQGGDTKVIDDPNLLPQAKHHIEIKARKGGYISGIHAESIGSAAMMLGAGRKTKDDRIDYAAGITLIKKIGQKVEVDDIIGVLHSNLETNHQAEQLFLDSFSITDEKPKGTQFIYDTLS